MTAGRRLRVVWEAADTVEALRRPYRAESDGAVRMRLHGLWLLRSGRSVGAVAATVGVQRWVRWIEAVVWDGAPSHHDGRLPRIGLALIALPPYSPELIPAERVFEELRREIEGQVFATLDEKVAAVEAMLRAWDADPVRVQRLTGWTWIHAAFDQLPAATALDPIAA